MTEPAPTRPAVDEPGTPAGVLATLATQADALAQRPLVVVPSQRLWAGWSARHALVIATLIPLLAWGFHSSAGNPPWAHPLWVVLTLVWATLGAALWASYLPLAHSATGQKRTRTATTQCARMAGIHIVTSAMVLSLNPTLSMALFAVAIAAGALFQRSSGTCPA